jgi:hypothetical protein
MAVEGHVNRVHGLARRAPPPRKGERMLILFIYKLAGMVTAAAVSTGSAIGVWYLNRRWNLHLSELELQRTDAYAHEAVTATEQRYKDAAKSAETNQQKLDFATRNLLGNLKRAGIKIDRTAAETIIEAQVNRLRSQNGVTTGGLSQAEKRDLAWTARDS